MKTLEKKEKAAMKAAKRDMKKVYISVELDLILTDPISLFKGLIP